MTSIFIYAFILSLFSNILIIFLSSKYSLFIDHSDTDKPQNFHEVSTPRSGGIGILSGVMLLLVSTFGLKLLFPVLFSFASGIFEDFHNSLSPRRRLFLQFIAALSAVWLTGSVVTYLGLDVTMPYWMGTIFSLFAIVGMMNAINIIDGFNGLASGVVLLILTSFAIVSYTQGNTDVLIAVSIVDEKAKCCSDHFRGAVTLIRGRAAGNVEFDRNTGSLGVGA
jgi:UDP-N-acetylmuramyl pentapeptide phosphotransferase/UDP-N-acetylglucosamine-1-phosphate transferase